MNEINLLQTAFLLFGCGIVVSVLLGKIFKRGCIVASAIIAILACCFSLASASLTLAHHNHFELFLPVTSLLGEFKLVVDPLSAFFILLISLLGIPVSIYSIGYLQEEYLNKSVGVMGLLYHLFLMSMMLVVSASHGLLFLILWECMTLVSFGFVIFDTQNVESQRAGYTYLLMTHVGSAFLMLMFAILAYFGGGFSFESFHHGAALMPMELKFLLFVFCLIGFGTKAGIIPLHIWLPEAHPAAPSHISALMSGVMIKTAIYGLLRFVFEFLAPFPWWWGCILLVIAITTAFLGIIYASVENDIKRLLAYSSIENMGIILIPIGVAMMFYSAGYTQLANLALMASLLHTFNHALFKGGLFMAAGAIVAKTHTRNMELLGGLIKRMPYTAVFFLVSALAISAFPPFNGFISEWLIFQTLLSAFQIHSEAIRLIAMLSAAMLGLVGAVVAVTFVKAFASTFLAMGRSHHVAHATEVSFTMKLGMLLLSLSCLVVGVFPKLVFPYLSSVSQSILGTLPDASVFVLDSQLVFVGQGNTASFSPVLIFLLLLGFIAFAMILPRLLGSLKTGIRREITWSCGVTPAPEFEHTPSGFSQPISVVFGKFHRSGDIYYRWIYLPIVRFVLSLSHRIKPFQSGSMQLYLVYIFAALIVSLIWVRL